MPNCSTNSHPPPPDPLSERMYQATLIRFRQDGFAAADLSMVASDCGTRLDELYRRFPRRESFINQLYERLAIDLEDRLVELPAGSVSSRFHRIMIAKLQAVRTHRDLLQRLLPVMLDPDNRLGVLGPFANRVRDRVMAIFEVVINGATNAPANQSDTQRLVRLLYGAHLGLVFLALQKTTSDATVDEATELIADLLEVMDTLNTGTRRSIGRNLFRLAGLAAPDELVARADRIFGGVVHPASDRIHFTTAENVLRDLFRFRRLLPGAEKCGAEPCPECLTLHLPRVEACIAQNLPIKLVLPAFPAKSPNLRKVTGPLPDFGEELALRFLQERCDAVREIYAPGAELIICSDGRVFSDVVGVSDDEVTAYRTRIQQMIEQLALPCLSIFDLDDINPQSDHDHMRNWLVQNYAESIADIRQQTLEHPHHMQLFNGIHRFMFEDLLACEPELSRNMAKRQSKEKAYSVIQRSHAWSRLVSGFFPDAVRLSIHPQAAHSAKVGILLTESDDPWLTPWHGVALLKFDRFVLTRRAEAEAMGAELIMRNGQPSHFELTSG